MFFSNSLYIRKSCTIFFYEKVVKWCIAKENRLDYYNALEAYAVRGELGEFTGLVAELEEEQLDTYMKLSQR